MVALPQLSTGSSHCGWCFGFLILLSVMRRCCGGCYSCGMLVVSGATARATAGEVPAGVRHPSKALARPLTRAPLGGNAELY
jgi:hypothetical protein